MITKPVRLTKKPITVEAMQFIYDDVTNTYNLADLREWTGHSVMSDLEWSEDGLQSWIVFKVYDKLHDTWVKFSPGDWIIHGIQGEYYPCVDSVKQATYDEEVRLRLCD